VTAIDRRRRAWLGALVAGGALFVPVPASAYPSGNAYLGVLLSFHGGHGQPVHAGLGAEASAVYAAAGFAGPIINPYAQISWMCREPFAVDLGSRAGMGMSVNHCMYSPLIEAQGELGLHLTTQGAGYRYGGTVGWLLNQVEVSGALPFDGSRQLEHGWGGTTVEVHARLGGLCAIGRPVRRDGVPVLPAAWGAASRRLADARGEHSSAAEFVRLARLLRALGAPGSLVARATRAAEEEAGHAVLTYALAALESGQPVAVGPMPVPRVERVPRAAAVAELRRRSLAEAEDEALAAEQAAEDADAPGLAGVLARRIAREERDHAVLGRELAAWAR
jgi:hypothetical protein